MKDEDKIQISEEQAEAMLNSVSSAGTAQFRSATMFNWKQGGYIKKTKYEKLMEYCNKLERRIACNQVVLIDNLTCLIGLVKDVFKEIEEK